MREKKKFFFKAINCSLEPALQKTCLPCNLRSSVISLCVCHCYTSQCFTVSLQANIRAESDKPIGVLNYCLNYHGKKVYTIAKLFTAAINTVGL
jgi:hypothetical protein